MPTPQQLNTDLSYILDQATGMPLLDELSLLRISLRRYLETGNAREAVAWAAEQISNSVSNFNHRKK